MPDIQKEPEGCKCLCRKCSRGYHCNRVGTKCRSSKRALIDSPADLNRTREYAVNLAEKSESAAPAQPVPNDNCEICGRPKVNSASDVAHSFVMEDYFCRCKPAAPSPVLTPEWDQEYPRDNRFHDPLKAPVLMQPSARQDIEIPFCDAPCGHSSQYCYTEDGGKNIICLVCERESARVGQLLRSLPYAWRIIAQCGIGRSICSMITRIPSRAGRRDRGVGACLDPECEKRTQLVLEDCRKIRKRLLALRSSRPAPEGDIDMGYMQYHAIVVTDHGYGTTLDEAHKIATEIFRWISPISPGMTNGVRAFFIPPDGSKEGWEESDQGNDNRSKFLAALEKFRYDDKSTPLDWVEVQFGDDDGETKIGRHSDMEVESATAPAQRGKP